MMSFEGSSHSITSIHWFISRPRKPLIGLAPFASCMGVWGCGCRKEPADALHPIRLLRAPVLPGQDPESITGGLSGGCGARGQKAEVRSQRAAEDDEGR